ncbi:unnamed protein product [Adineta steineri]|uniref:Protein kinase domain-containing protein n=2 Tax=Adineta steineri TaxID=433720 RepID=A0A814AE81_9BILA|nr:unnamed protein product [Adineta steineri]CAF3815911.1 unnamed protein product [Adineta steineri]CAF3886528.1 unnamed protein product [Adineta steineri]
MGLIESRLGQLNRIPSENNSWRITSVNFARRIIKINKTNYIIGEHELGRGAFGRVYPARRSTDGVNVAIKVVSLAEDSEISPLLGQAFLNEILQSKRLSAQSKHVVRMYDFDFDPVGLAFIVMERGGLDLEKTLINKRTISIAQQKNLWKQMLNILITLHKNSLVHLDLKPSNLVFFGDRLKLVDLGIAQKANSRGQGPNGTFGFTAPEVRLIPHNSSPRYTHKADIWSLGAILYWINYGHGPQYDQHDRSYRPPPGIPSARDPNIVDVLRHTLRMNPHQRPHTDWLARHPFTRSF